MHEVVQVHYEGKAEGVGRIRGGSLLLSGFSSTVPASYSLGPNSIVL